MKWSGGAARKRNGRGEWHPNYRSAVHALEYSTLTVDEIIALPVESLSEPESAALFLWTPDPFAFYGKVAEVARAWGFIPGRFLIWQKGMALGKFPRPAHELCLVAHRGTSPFSRSDVPSVQSWKLVYQNGHRIHSAKPDGFYDLVESVSPGPYLELFARRQRLGWDTWGDQALCHIELHG
jgi:N6-adenosine-specific RNA methylase IME4